MTPVARDGELVLYADEQRANGLTYNEITKKASRVQRLQVFFKWGNFKPLEDARALYRAGVAGGSGVV